MVPVTRPANRLSRRPKDDRVGEAGQLLSSGQFPPEGKSLGELVKQLVPPEVWSECTDATGERLRPHLKAIAKLSSVGLNEAILPLLERWNSGTLIARGRRGDPLSPPIEIPPPSTGWDLWIADFGRSTIQDPTFEGKKIYDLRFFPSDTNARALPRWCADEIKRMKAAGEVHDGTRITELARLLADRLTKASNAGNTSIRPVKWRHIKNMLPAWGLWLSNSIK